MIHILGILFSTLGSGVLCAGMAKHQSRLVGRKLPPSTVRLMKFGGFVVLALALAIDASGLGAAYGLIAWFGHLTVGAAVILLRLCSFNSSGLRRSGPVPPHVIVFMIWPPGGFRLAFSQHQSSN